MTSTMKKNWAIASCLMACLVAMAFILIHSSRDKEPLYEGKPLSAWLVALNGPPEDRPSATNQLRKLGTNVVPELYEMRFTEDSRIERLATRVIRHLLRQRKYQPMTEQRRYLASRGLKALGEIAAPFVVSQLASEEFIFEKGPQPGRPQRFETNPAHQAASVLFHEIGPPAVPALLGALTNSNVSIRYHACYAIATLNNTEMMTESVLAPITPLVTDRLLSDPDMRVRCMSANALGNIAHFSPAHRDGAVQAFATALNDETAQVRYGAAIRLGMIRTNALLAAPALTNALALEESRNTNLVTERGIGGSKASQDVKQAIANALKQINPPASAPSL